MKKVIALVLFAAGIAAAVNAADYTPTAPSPRTDATDTPVNAEPPTVNTIEVAPVLITAKLPRAVRPATSRRQTAQCGAFVARSLTQGTGSVRGFCTQ